MPPVTETRWGKRYADGEHEPVWQEMVAAGTRIRRDEALVADAEAVALETMRRVRVNVVVLEERLRGLGYEFEAERQDAEWPRQVIQPIDPLAQVKLAGIEHQIGPIPISVRAFFMEVGGVAFNGRLPGWSVPYTDALEVITALDGLDEHLADMRDDPDWQAALPEDERGTVHLELSADYLHKANVSGGRPYGVLLPDARADTPWRYDDLHAGLYFVEYLRSVISDGGLPGWRRTPGNRPPPDIEALTAQLVPF